MGRAVDHLRGSGRDAPDHLLAHVAPLGWSHISLAGDCNWRDSAAGGDEYLELRVDNRLSGAA